MLESGLIYEDTREGRFVSAEKLLTTEDLKRQC